MTNHAFDLDTEPAKGDIQRLYDGVRAHNQKVAGTPPPESFAVFLRDDSGAIVGGVQGELWGASLHIAATWVAPSHQGHGHGAALMRRAEAHARALGYTIAHTETLSFQARPFYEKLGYQVFGEIPGIAEGITFYYLKKSLQ